MPEPLAGGDAAGLDFGRRVVPIAEQIACVTREIEMRRRVYPRWVQDGRMKPTKAQAEIEAMEAVLATLKGAL
ncbi:hypothetical protein [Elioraea sp.]|uniref:hypothetical protein n=1 Tax=Elioraea sp. TaxID=2185103 RepID=UPI0025C07A2B|nr:hypothetical protein [Elioraea sp.]